MTPSFPITLSPYALLRKRQHKIVRLSHTPPPPAPASKRPSPPKSRTCPPAIRLARHSSRLPAAPRPLLPARPGARPPFCPLCPLTIFYLYSNMTHVYPPPALYPRPALLR